MLVGILLHLGIFENAFSPDYKFSYKGMSEPTTTVFSDDGDEVCVSFRDEGEDEHAPTSFNMYKAFDTFIIVYDVSDQSSLQHAEANCYAIKRTLYNRSCTILVGNKCDMEGAINAEDVKQFARNEYLLHIETSAKENINIQEMLMLLLSKRLHKPCTGKWQSSSISSSQCKNTSLQIQKETTDSGTEQSQSFSTSDSQKIQPKTVTTTKSGPEQGQSLSISNSANNNFSHQNVTTSERSSCCVIS